MASGKVFKKTEVPFLIKTFSASYSAISNNSTKSFTSSDLGYSVPSGYVPFCISRATTGKTKLHIISMNLPVETDTMLTIRNESGSSSTAGTAYMRIVFLKKKFIQYPENDGHSVSFGKIYTGAEDYSYNACQIGFLDTTADFSNGKFMAGSTVSFVILTTTYYQFQGLTLSGISYGDLVSEGSQYSFTMPDNDVSIIARFYKTQSTPTS